MILPDWINAGLSQMTSMSPGIILFIKTTLLLTISWLVYFSLSRFNPRYRVLLWRGVVSALVIIICWNSLLPSLELPVLSPKILEVTESSIVSIPITPELSQVPKVEFSQANIADSNTIDPDLAVTTIPQPIMETSNKTHDSAQPVRAPSFSISWLQLGISLWGFGVVVLFARFGFGISRLKILLHSSKPASDIIFEEVQRINTELGGRRPVKVQSNPEIAVPIIIGLRKSVIVLPQRMCEKSFDAQRPAIIAHELTHAHSRDVVWNIFIHIVQILFWFHPLVWKISSAHRADCDAVCDSVSSSYTGDVKTYCQILARVALEAHNFSYAGVLSMAHHSDIRRRLASLQNSILATALHRRTVMGITLSGLVVVSLLAGLQLTVAEETSPNNTVAEKTAAKEPIATAEANIAETQKNNSEISTSEAEEEAAETETEFIINDENGPISSDGNIQISGQYENGYYFSKKFLINQGRGKMLFKNSSLKYFRITVDAPEFKTFTKKYSVKKDKKSFEVASSYKINLKKMDRITGVILDKKGKPLSGAEVILGPKIQNRYIRDNRIQYVKYLNKYSKQVKLVHAVAISDKDGRFSFSPQKEAFILLVTHDLGYAKVENQKVVKEITIQPWARVEGVFKIRNKPVPNENIVFSNFGLRRGEFPESYYDYKTITDKEGKFTFEKIYEGRGLIRRIDDVHLKNGITRLIPTHYASAKIEPGKTTTVLLSRSGRAITGKLLLPDSNTKFDWNNANVTLSILKKPKLKRPNIPWPKGIDPDKNAFFAMKWKLEWKETEEGKRILNEIDLFHKEEEIIRNIRINSTVNTTVDQNGSFTFEDMPANEYQLWVSTHFFSNKDSSFIPRHQVGTLKHTFVVPSIPGGQSEEPFDLGELKLKRP